MRVAFVLAVLAAVVVMGDGEAAKDVNLDEIEKVDASVFTDQPPAKNTPLEQAASDAVSARDADLDADTESVVALASESGANAADQTMYSFRAMRQATAVAGSSVSEKASETHAAAMRILSHGNSVSAEDMFAEISREQQILVAKRALVTRQKQSITDSEESLGRLKRLISENKKILQKNEHALRRASDDLLRLISKYQNKLRAGLTKEVGGTADTPLGVPVRSRPHQRAAYTKWAERGKRTVDTIKSKAALAASNAKNQGKDAQDKAVKKVVEKKAEKIAAKAKAAAKPAAAKPAAAAAKPAAKAAAAKAKFAQVHGEEEADASGGSEAEAEAESESASEAKSEAEESESAEDESEEESESESEAEDADEAEDESEEEEESASLIEKDSDAESEEEAEATYNPLTDRSAALPGLAPPPHLYNPDDDTFI